MRSISLETISTLAGTKRWPVSNAYFGVCAKRADAAICVEIQQARYNGMERFELTSCYSTELRWI